MNTGHRSWKYDLNIGLGGADGGRPKLEIPKEKLAAQMRKDLEHVRKLMRQAQLV